MMNSTIKFLIFFFSFTAAQPLKGQNQLIFADQRLATVYSIIQKFKNTISSDPLGVRKSWVGPNICSYTGFYCDTPPDNNSAIALASIDFNGFQLTASTLDGFLDQLSDIAIFHANSNNFGGTLSPNIANLPYLYELDISNNQFFGPFPSAILGMNSLNILDIRFNYFTGSVPPQLFTKDQLDALFINNNNFMQRLPDNFITSHYFQIMSSLTEILLLNNLLSGCLPYELGFLNEAVVFDAGNNRLTGPLPFSLGCLENVEILNFARNQLYGIVPDVICALGNSVNLSLSDNYLKGFGPSCLRLLENGVLDLRNNCIPGLPFQKSVTECVSYFAYPRYCPHMATYTYIPCWLSNFSTPPLDLPKLVP
ncbi:unnamed protein product [Withania somnifera]